MGQTELVEFRTTQHSSLGTNSWGGASPLLARNLPKESLQQRYIKLNTVRRGDEIFPGADEQFNRLYQIQESEERRMKPHHRISKLLSKWFLARKTETLGSNYKEERRWFPRLDPKKRWPNGWC